jgi:signal transduction histidine kinase
MPETLRKLFESEFMPHGMCYLWEPRLIWLHVISDALIAVAYLLIPLTLIYFVRRRRDIPFDWMFLCFGIFIVACGATHAVEVWNVWHGNYWLAGGIKVITALTSIPTAFLLMRLVPRGLAIPSPAQLAEVNEGLNREIATRQEAEQKLQRHAIELAEANERLVQAERLKTEFLSNVSHELRTPLTLILSPVESLLATEERKLTSTQRRRLETIHNNSVRLLKMVTGLLDFSRLEAGQIELRREPTEIVALTHSLFLDFQPLMKRKGLHGEFESETPRAWVSMDRYLFERIVFNLLSNAVKFTNEGGKILVQLRWKTEQLTLSVNDTGIGVPASEIRHIFQRFRQVESSAVRRFEGVGLGLALVKEFTELLGGRIEVDSRVGTGSTFTVTLAAPRAVPAESSLLRRTDRKLIEEFSEPAAAPAVREESNGKPTVLLAEDNLELSAHMQALLRDICDVQPVANGREALEFLGRGCRADLLVADVMMPLCDGLTLCREVKRKPETRELPVVLLTALTHRDALLEGWKAGADEYLFKPFHPMELVTRIRSLLAAALDRTHARKEMQQLSAELLRIRDDERQRIARDIHDGIGQYVTGLSLGVARLRTAVDMTRTDVCEAFSDFGELITRLGDEIRNLSYVLHPPMLEELGIASALNWYVRGFAQRSGIEVCLSIPPDFPRMSSEVEIALFRIVQESLTNVQRHSRSPMARVRLAQDAQEIVLNIEDEGRGMPSPSSVAGRRYGAGIPGMRERVRQLHGTLDMESYPGKGVKISVRLPAASRAKGDPVPRATCAYEGTNH